MIKNTRSLSMWNICLIATKLLEPKLYTISIINLRWPLHLHNIHYESKMATTFTQYPL